MLQLLLRQYESTLGNWIVNCFHLLDIVMKKFRTQTSLIQDTAMKSTADLRAALDAQIVLEL